MKLESIEIHGMHRIDAKGKVYNLDDTNYLTGPNGAGKSTVLQAIQLALLGYIPGTDKKPSAIFTHACASVMSVTATILNGSERITITRTYKLAGASATASCVVTPDTYTEKDIPGWLGGLEVPVFDFGEFMGMTANKLKEWFIGFLPKSATSADWSTIFVDNNRLTAPYTESIRQKLLDHATKIKAEGIDGVIAMNEFAKTTSTAVKSDLARVMSTLQELVYYDDADPTVTTVAQVEKIINDAQAERIRLNNLMQNMIHRDRIQKAIDALGISQPLSENTDYADAIQKRKAAQEAATALVQQYTDLGSEVTKLEAEILTLEKVIKSGGVCPFTSQKCDTIGTLIDDYMHQIYSKRDVISSCTAKRTNLKTKRDLEEAAFKSATQIIQKLESDYAQYDALMKQMPQVEAIDADDLGARLAEADRTVRDQTDVLVKLRANETYNKLADKLKADKARMEFELEYLKEIVKQTSTAGLQSKLAEAAFLNFIDKMNPTIDAIFGGVGFKAKFNLAEKANSFSIGLTRNDVFTPYELLSSGEKCLFTFALVTTLIQVSDSQLPIILMDDLVDHLDKENAESFFSNLDKVKGVQTVIAGVQPYSTSLREGVLITIEK